MITSTITDTRQVNWRVRKYNSVVLYPIVNKIFGKHADICHNISSDLSMNCWWSVKYTRMKLLQTI